jgi:uncharacterized protein (DUF885 family)
VSVTIRTKSRFPKYLLKPRVVARIFTVGMIVLLSAVSAAGHAVAPQPSLAKTSVQTRTQALNVLFTDYWEEYLRQSPEAATALGDKRYNDRWSDLSPAETERSLRRNRAFVKRLRAIDTAELSAQDQLSADLLLRTLLEDQESAKFKEWEKPLNQIHGIHFELPQLVSIIPFDAVNDYDNYIARLGKVPRLFGQLTANMQLGIRDGSVQPKVVSEKVLAQVNSILAIPPEDSPFVARPKNFLKASVPLSSGEFHARLTSLSPVM